MALLFLAIFVATVIALVTTRTRLLRKSQQAQSQWHLAEGKRKDGTIMSNSPNVSNMKEKQPSVLAQMIEPLPDFDWTAVEPTKYRPFKPTYHITMALQTSTPSELIVMDRDYLDKINQRRTIMADNASTVMGVIPEGHAAVWETYSYLLGEYLPTRYPSTFELRNHSHPYQHTTFLNKATGVESPLTPLPSHPIKALKIICETVEDDMFILEQQPDIDPTFPGEHKSIAFVCCHPAGFDPSEKLGKGLKAIHAPVPAYDKIGPSMERYFARAEVGKPVRRVNWSVQTHTRLFAPSGNHVHAGDLVEEETEVDVNTARLRVELQTLTRLPKTRALVFSFKTYLYPMADIKEEGLGPQLADAVEGLKAGNAPGMWIYKGGVRWGKAVCEYLRS